MSGAVGPGPIPAEVDDMPEGWEAFYTNDAEQYYCIPAPEIYYYCRSLDRVQWDKPDMDEAIPYYGERINGKRPFLKGDEKVPAPPPERQYEYENPYYNEKYVASCEDPADVFQPDEDMLESCIDCDLPKLKKALNDGADVSLPNWPWQNTPLHLANGPFYWDADTLKREKELRFEMTEFLVRQGADLDAENIFHCKAIDFAIFHNYPDNITLLEEKGSKFGWFGAAYSGKLDRIKELLEEGIDIDLKGRFGRTAFAEAHLRGQWQVECFLAQQGCSKELPHAEFIKFNPGGGATPIGNLLPPREIQYYREDDKEWYDDMMSKRFPNYLDKMSHLQEK